MVVLIEWCETKIKTFISIKLPLNSFILWKGQQSYRLHRSLQSEVTKKREKRKESRVFMDV